MGTSSARSRALVTDKTLSYKSKITSKCIELQGSWDGGTRVSRNNLWLWIWIFFGVESWNQGYHLSVIYSHFHLLTSVVLCFLTSVFIRNHLSGSSVFESFQPTYVALILVFLNLDLALLAVPIASDMRCWNLEQQLIWRFSAAKCFYNHSLYASIP